jgi:DNA (cytosine-5)-methyltransferase 1
MQTPVALELFAGCGGLSTGFLDAGYRVAAGFDVDRRAIEAYEYNHAYRGAKGVVADIASLSGDELLRLAGLETADVLLGGPPCQPFSIVGKRRGVQDRRASLVFDFLRIIDDIKPHAVVFENVPNLATIENGAIVDEILGRLRAMGYLVSAGILLAADFGVPQMRRRLFIVGARDVTRVCMPVPSHGSCDLLSPDRGPYVTARQALEDLPPAAEFGECGVYNHEPTEHTSDMLARFASLPPGRREPRSFHDRLHPDRPAFTLRAGTGNFSPLRPVHYRYDRVVTVRESARLQGFRDDFIWPDWIPRLQQYRQVGNAVPPPLAGAVGRTLADTLGWTLAPEDTVGVPDGRPTPLVYSDEERRARRRSRIRGASLGWSPRR